MTDSFREEIKVQVTPPQQPLDSEKLSFSDNLVSSGIAELRKELLQVKNGGLMQEGRTHENSSRQYLGIFDAGLTHSGLATPKKASPEAVDFMKSDEDTDKRLAFGSPSPDDGSLKISTITGNFGDKEVQTSIGNSGMFAAANRVNYLEQGLHAKPEGSDVEKKLSQLQQNYEELVDEFCRVKVDKANTERELVDVLNCIENLADPRNVPCSIIRESAMSISDKNLQRLKGYFKEKNFIL